MMRRIETQAIVVAQWMFLAGRRSGWTQQSVFSELFAPGAGMACTTSRHIGMAAAIIFIATHRLG